MNNTQSWDDIWSVVLDFFLLPWEGYTNALNFFRDGFHIWKTKSNTLNVKNIVGVTLMLLELLEILNQGHT